MFSVKQSDNKTIGVGNILEKNGFFSFEQTSLMGKKVYNNIVGIPKGEKLNYCSAVLIKSEDRGSFIVNSFKFEKEVSVNELLPETLKNKLPEKEVFGIIEFNSFLKQNTIDSYTKRENGIVYSEYYQVEGMPENIEIGDSVALNVISSSDIKKSNNHDPRYDYYYRTVTCTFKEKLYSVFYKLDENGFIKITQSGRNIEKSKYEESFLFKDKLGNDLKEPFFESIFIYGKVYLCTYIKETHYPHIVPILIDISVDDKKNITKTIYLGEIKETVSRFREVESNIYLKGVVPTELVDKINNLLPNDVFLFDCLEKELSMQFEKHLNEGQAMYIENKHLFDTKFQELENLCKNYDYYYPYSDDRFVYNRGVQNEKKVSSLIKELKKIDPFRVIAIVTEYCNSLNPEMSFENLLKSYSLVKEYNYVISKNNMKEDSFLETIENSQDEKKRDESEIGGEKC